MESTPMHESHEPHPGSSATAQTELDPVCGMKVNPASARGGSYEHAGHTYYFCNPRCRERFANAPAYTAAKHGVLGLTKATALELAQEKIRVNAVCPAFIETPMVMERGVKAGSDAAAYVKIAALHPMHRLGKADEIASAVLWLCSDGASFVTGEHLLVDGGYVVR